MTVQRDWLVIPPSDPERDELLAELRAENEAAARLNEDLCRWARGLEKRIGELSRGRRTVAASAELLAELPLRPTTAQKRAAAARHGVSLHQVNRLVREAGLDAPASIKRKFSSDF